MKRPDPPLFGKVTHHSIELTWAHVKKKLPSDQRFKYNLQEIDHQKKNKEWGNIYAGYGIIKIAESLEPNSEYSYRLLFINKLNKKSEYSEEIKVKTIKEPITGEAFQKAIALDRKAEVETICDSDDGQRVIEIPDKFGNLPIMIAVNRNNLDMVELLISKGCDVNAQNENGKTALMLAAFAGKLNIIKELHASDASLTLRDKAGLSVLHYAVDGGNTEAVQYFLFQEENGGVDINAKDKNGWSPLLRSASIGGTQQTAEMLVRYKADVNLLDNENKTALMVAIINGNQPFVQVLIEAGANLNVKNEYGRTAYEMAVAMDRRRVVKYLDEYLEEKNGGSK